MKDNFCCPHCGQPVIIYGACEDCETKILNDKESYVNYPECSICEDTFIKYREYTISIAKRLKYILNDFEKLKLSERGLLTSENVMFNSKEFIEVILPLIKRIDDSYDEGYSNGYDEGYSDNSNSGYDEGYSDGINEINRR